MITHLGLKGETILESRFIAWVMHELWFGKVVLLGIGYAIAGKPVKPQA